VSTIALHDGNSKIHRRLAIEVYREAITDSETETIIRLRRALGRSSRRGSALKDSLGYAMFNYRSAGGLGRQSPPDGGRYRPEPLVNRAAAVVRSIKCLDSRKPPEQPARENAMTCQSA
jgi:hypothetical protein